MIYSDELLKKAKDNKVPVQTFVMADLISIGYSEDDAYFIAFGLVNGSMSDKQNESVKQNIVNSNAFASLVIKRKKEFVSNAEVSDGLEKKNSIELFTKEKVATEMLRSALTLKDNDPDRVAALMKYADLMGMKKEDVKIDEEATSYYLPLKCGICPYKEKFMVNK